MGSYKMCSHNNYVSIIQQSCNSKIQQSCNSKIQQSNTSACLGG